MDGLLFYLVKIHKMKCYVQERDISPIISLAKQRSPLSAQIDRSTHFALRYRALCHQSTI